ICDCRRRIRCARSADAHGRVQSGVSEPDTACFKIGPDALADQFGHFRSTRHDGSKFLAAKPGDHVVDTHAGTRRFRKAADDLVSHRVPEAVVDGFEAVEIEYEDADWTSRMAFLLAQPVGCGKKG